MHAAFRRLLPFLLLAGVAWADEGGAGPAGRAPTREEALAGRDLTRPLPDWAWWPGRARLWRRAARAGGEVLVSMDPATGTVEDVLALGEVEALVDRPGAVPMRRIGRASPPTVVWAPSGRALVLVVRGDLVWVDLAQGRRRRLTATPSPLYDVNVSPDGRHVAFGRDDDLWVVDTASGDPRPLTTGGREELRNASLDWLYPEELDLDTAIWWAPDSRAVAWLRLDERPVPRVPFADPTAAHPEVRWMRYPRAGEPNPVPRVAVSPIDGGAPVWLDLGTPAPEYVARVAWFPDGRDVAVVTLDRAQRRLRLLACPADGGPARTVLEERDAAWVEVPPAPSFLPDGSFLWRSEREGDVAWWHVRPRPDRAGVLAATRLTAPGVDVAVRPAFDPVALRVAYHGIPHDALRSACYAHAVGAPARAPGFPDDAWDAVAALDGSGRWALVTWSSTTTPPRRDVRPVDGSRPPRLVGDARTEALEALALPTAEHGTTPVAGAPASTGPVRWRLWRPAVLDPAQPRPIVVDVYGGPGSRSVRDRWSGGVVQAAYLVARGFVVLEVDGRGTAGHGAAHVRSVVGRLGVLELEDVVAAVRDVARRPGVDGTRVGVIGWSYGGTMAALAATRRPDVFTAAVAVAPVTDWRLYDSIYTERYMGLPEGNAEGYAASSVLEGLRAGRVAPLLLMHGADDDNVHVQNTWRLVEALAGRGTEGFETMVYPRGGHGLGPFHLDVRRRRLEFLERHLLGATPVGGR